MRLVLEVAMTLLVLGVLLADAWQFLTDEERGRLILWIWYAPWVPNRFVESDWFSTLFWRYVRFDQAQTFDPLKEFPS